MRSTRRIRFWCIETEPQQATVDGLNTPKAAHNAYHLEELRAIKLSCVSAKMSVGNSSRVLTLFLLFVREQIFNYDQIS